MELVFTKQIGTQEVKPVSIDSTSSNTVVYIRRNIMRVTKEDVETGEKMQFWEYEEAVIPTETYSNNVNSINLSFSTANAETLASMTEILVNMSETLSETLIAVTSLSEMMLEKMEKSDMLADAE